MAVINGNSRLNVLFGTFGDDVMNGYGGNDWMFGSVGVDTLNGGNGHDRLFGMWGNDILNGGEGNDLMLGGSGADRLYGGNGHDRMFGGSGDDLMNGGAGHDRMIGGAGNDRIAGGTGNDLGVGGSGNDLLSGGKGFDKMYGGSGDDMFLHNAAEDSGYRDYYSGDSGTDKLIVTLNAEEAADDAIMSDLEAFEAFQATGSDSWFKIQSLNLYVRNIEELRVITPEPIEPVNSAPVISGGVDLGATDEDTTISFTAADLLANTTDADSDALTVSNVTASTGTVELIDGTYVYTPDANENGNVAFSYDVSDGTETVAASATLDVAAVNDGPSVSGAVDLGSSDEDTSRSFTAADLLANASDIDSGTLTVENVTASTGSVALIGGEYVYTPDANANGVVTFNYAVSDGTAIADATATLDVAAVNDAPEASDLNVSVDEHGTVSILPLAGVTDVDGDTLSIASFDATGAAGSIVTGEAGELIYTPDGGSLALGETLADSFTFTVTDGQISDTATVNVTVVGVNDGPVAVDDGLLLEENFVIGDATVEGVNAVNVVDTIALDVLANDTDMDTSDTLQITGINASADLLERASISIVGTGADQRIVFDADESLFFAPVNPGPGGPPPDGAILVGGPGGPIGGGFPIQEDLVQFEYTVSDGTDEDVGLVSLYVYNPAEDIIF